MSRQLILFLPSFESGGVERNAVFFANGMAARNYVVHLVYCRRTHDWFERLDASVIRHRIPRGLTLPLVHERIIDAVNMLLFCGFAIRRIRRQGDTVMVGFQSNVIAILLGLVTRVPVVARLSNHYMVARHEPSRLRKFAEFSKKCLYRFADAVIANSAELATDYGSLLKRQVITIENPVDFDLVRRLGDETLDDPLFLHKDRPIIVSAGRLSRQKNFELLLRAMAKVASQVSCYLVILGEGAQRAELEKLAEDLDIAGIVFLPGYQKNPYKFFRAADLFVLSSNYEGMPNVLIEALACELPAVATRCKSGPAEILCDGAGGELVPVGDQEALAAAIVKSLNQPQVTRDKQALATDHLNRYEISRIEDKYDEMLGNLY